MKKPSRSPSQRQLRVGEVLRHTLSDIFARGETRDVMLDQAGLTVLEVSISPDLKKATAYVMPLGGANQKAVLERLEKMCKPLRGLISKNTDLKFTPEISFKLDTSLDYASHIDNLLEDPNVARDIESSTEHSSVD